MVKNLLRKDYSYAGKFTVLSQCNHTAVFTADTGDGFYKT